MEIDTLEFIKRHLIESNGKITTARTSKSNFVEHETLGLIRDRNETLISLIDAVKKQSGTDNEEVKV